MPSKQKEEQVQQPKPVSKTACRNCGVEPKPTPKKKVKKYFADGYPCDDFKERFFKPCWKFTALDIFDLCIMMSKSTAGRAVCHEYLDSLEEEHHSVDEKHNCVLDNYRQWMPGKDSESMNFKTFHDYHAWVTSVHVFN